MALSLSSSSRVATARSARTRPAPAPRPRSAVVVRAGLKEALEDIAKGFMTIFSPPQSTVKDWQSTGVTGFKGEIRHHEDGHGRPFKDGVVRMTPDAAAAAAQGGAAEGGAMDYVGDALERVVGHNFTGDGTEPPAGAGSAGWKGDIHDRKREGFHNPKNW